jgi:hypothetical protein
MPCHSTTMSMNCSCKIFFWNSLFWGNKTQVNIVKKVKAALGTSRSTKLELEIRQQMEYDLESCFATFSI